jgi:SPP1 gp7 family putative phage head morphogenesis protein
MKKTPNIPTQLKHVDVTKILRQRGTYLKQKQNEALKELSKQMLKSQQSKKAKAEPVEKPRSAQFTNEQINSYWEKQIRVVEVVEQQFENKLRQYIRKIGDAYLKEINDQVKGAKSLAKFAKKDFFSDHKDDFFTEAKIDFEPILESVATIAGNNANDFIGVDTPYIPYNYREKIAENVHKFTKSMLDTDRQVLTDILNEAIKEGKNIADIVSSIEKVFEEYSKSQAARIAQTEIIRTSNQAAVDAYKQSGIVEGKQWVTFGAEDDCSQYDGEIVTLSDNFYKGGNEFQDGDPPLHPNCKCVVIPVVAD